MKLNKYEKMLALIALSMGLSVACNIWGEVFLNTIHEFFKHIFV